MKACKLAILLGVCLGLWSTTPAWAQGAESKIVYNPGTKSYFQFLSIDNVNYLTPNAGSDKWKWPNAEKIAEKLEYKGVHGRLAVVKNLETHEFLERTFQPTEPTWIGLRYWCATKRLQFTDGSYWEPGNFHAWASAWDQSNLPDPCWEWHAGGKPQFMPVAYSPMSDGFRWIAEEWHKGYPVIIVEFPTGQP